MNLSFPRNARQTPIRWGDFYLIPFALLPATAVFLQTTTGNTPLLYGQAASLVASFLLAVISGLLWLRAPRDGDRSRLLKLFILVFAANWFAGLVSVVIEGFAYLYALWLIPLLLILVALRPPSPHAARLALDFFAVSLIVISATSHALHLTGIIPYSDAFTSRLPNIFSSLGFDYRWAGPFANTSDAAPVGLFLFSYSLIRGRPLGIVIGLIGLVILAVTTSRSAIFGALAATGAYLWFHPKVVSTVAAKRLRWPVAVLCSMCAGLLILVRDPTGNGRLFIWQDYLLAWKERPWLGLGTSQIIQRFEEGDLSHYHAHNLYVNVLTGQGVIGLLVLGSILALAAYVSFLLGKQGLSGFPAWIVGLMTFYFGESLLDFRYFGYMSAQVFFIPLLAILILPTKTTSRAVHLRATGFRQLRYKPSGTHD